MTNLAKRSIKHSVTDILAELNATRGEAINRCDVYGGTPHAASVLPPYTEFADAWNSDSELIYSSESAFCDSSDDTFIIGEYSAICVDYDEFNHYFCAGCCPLPESEFPRWLIMVQMSYTYDDE